jgi:hypothetical protein
VAAVAEVVEGMNGVTWAALVDALVGDRQTADTALAQLLDAAQTLPSDTDTS